jgi:hypothetical protein
MRWGFLALSVILLFKPVIPWVEYLLNQEYIAANLCINAEIADMECQGSCYLKSNLESEFDQSQDPKANPSKLTWEITPFTTDIAAVYKMSAVVLERLTFLGGMAESLYHFEPQQLLFRPPAN